MTVNYLQVITIYFNFNLIIFLNHFLSCTVSIFYALYWVFFRRETFFRLNRFYLLGTLFLGMILPFLNFTFINENSPIAATNYLKTVTIGVENLATTIVVTPESIGSDFQWNWLLILKGIYGVGVAFFSIKFLFGLWIIFDLYKNSNKTQYADYQLIENKTIRIPFSFFQLLFWNNALNKADPDHQKILQHELAHIRQFHSVDVVILELLSIAFWWNPVVWFYKKSLRTVHEYLADDAVLQTTQKKQYGQLLIRQSHSGMQIALANNFIQSQLKNRIMMMMKSKSKSQQLWKYLLFLPVFGLLFMAFSCENAKAQSESKTAEANLSNPDDDVFKVVEEMPRFAGTDVVNLKDEESRRVASNKLLIEYIIDQIKYPESAKKTGIEGISVVNFIVNKTGRLTDVKIMRSLSPDIDAEAIRVVENMPDWIPGRQQGKLVNVSYNLPIKFKLDGDEPSTGGIHESNLSKKTSLEDVDTKPYFPGCEDLTGEEKENCSNQKLLQFVYTNIKYPKEAQKEEAEGMVVVKFVVAKNGKLSSQKSSNQYIHFATLKYCVLSMKCQIGRLLKRMEKR